MNGDGYVHVARIPASATYIELREHSNNDIGAYRLPRIIHVQHFMNVLPVLNVTQLLPSVDCGLRLQTKSIFIVG